MTPSDRSPLRPERRHDPELMDAPGLPDAEVRDAYRVLTRVNRQFFGGRRVLLAELARLLGDDPAGPRSWIDLGSGSGDLPAEGRAFLRSRGLDPAVVALDRDAVALGMAAESGLPAVRADALRLPFADATIDVVTAVKFAHHFADPGPLLAEMARVARRRVLVLDIRRSWLAYWGFVAWSRTFTANRLVRYDGPLSVLRGFTAPELHSAAGAIPGFAWTVRPYAGFQLALIGTRDRRG